MRTAGRVAQCLAVGMLAIGARPSWAQGPSVVTGTAQSVGQAHTLRQIPEACIRIEGQFTGRVEHPYALTVVPLPASCQPRARFHGQLDEERGLEGWRLSQRIDIPAAGCPGQVARFALYQRDGQASPERDGQGQTRVYLEQSRQQAREDKLARLPGFAVRLTVTGRCPHWPYDGQSSTWRDDALSW